MKPKFHVCKQPAGNGPCGLRFHEDDYLEFLEHLEDHGVDVTEAHAEAMKRPAWWDEEHGFSAPPVHGEEKVVKGTPGRLVPDDPSDPDGPAHYERGNPDQFTTVERTPVMKSQFGDGDDADRRENARNFAKLRRLENEGHRLPAGAFDGQAKEWKEVESKYYENSSSSKGEVVQPPKVGLFAGEPATSQRTSEVGNPDLAGGLRDRELEPATGAETSTSRSGRKGRKENSRMAGKKSTNPYADAPVIDLSVGSAKAAERICVTTGRGYNDTDAIRTILELVQKAHPNAVITNQGKWDGDQLVGNVAESIGLSYEMTLPKFLEARRRGQPIIEENVKMTPEQNAEFGFVELQKRMASTCTELHVFGTPSGPQRGLIEAFNEAEKLVKRWGASTD